MRSRLVRGAAAMLLLLQLLLLVCSCGDGNDPAEETGVSADTSAELIQKTTEALTEAGLGGTEVTEYTVFETGRGSMVAPVIDIQTALNSHSYDYNRIREEMRILADLGFTRVYFVVATNGFGMSCWPKWDNATNRYISGYTFVMRNCKALAGDPNRFYITACKNAGMEAFAIYKPYEGGGTATVPESVAQLNNTVSNAWISTLGGYIYHTDSFIAEHPEYRIQRKADTERHEELPVTSLEIDFILSSYRAGNTIFSNGVSASAVKNAAENCTLWMSGDNGTYAPYGGTFSISFKEKKEVASNTSGVDVGTYNYVTLRLEGLSATYEQAKYFAVTFEDSSVLHTMPHSGFRLYNGETLLSSTVTSFCRYPANKSDTPKNHDWGNEASKPLSGSLIGGIKVGANGSVSGVQKGSTALNGSEDFYQWGFSFGWIYDTEFALYANSAVYGIARGTIEYVPGGLCEAYPEVREYWLSQIKLLLQYGADGIDIRPESHSTMVIDYTNYGYNQPIVDQYQALYGVDIRAQEADYLKLAKIRGDFFLEFLEDAAELTHSYQASFLTHLVASYENPSLSTSVFCVGHFTDPKIILDWQKTVELCDEITIKDNTYGAYNSKLASEIRAYAQKKGKPVWMHSYLQQGKTDNKTYINAADKDGKTDGILLYELTFDANYSPTLIQQVKEILEGLDCQKVTYKIK